MYDSSKSNELLLLGACFVHTLHVIMASIHIVGCAPLGRA